MRLAIATALTALLGAFAGGCGSDSDDPATADGPLVTYERSGGFAGVSERLEIDSDGSARLSLGQPDPAEQAFAIGDSELSKLRSDLRAADFAAIDPTSGLGCADCFEYEIAYGGQTASFTEAAEVPDSVRAVTGELGQIVEAHLPERP
jgi:hypothetical protein